MEWCRITVHAWPYVMCSSLSNVILYRASALCLEVRLKCVNLILFGIRQMHIQQVDRFLNFDFVLNTFSVCIIIYKIYSRSSNNVPRAFFSSMLSIFPMQIPNAANRFPPKIFIAHICKTLQACPTGFH